MPPTIGHLTTAGAALTLSAVLWKYFHTKKAPYPLPPGPKGNLVLGNLLDLPNEHAARTYGRWGEAYGDVVYVSAMGQPIVILNSVKAATDLLDRRSAIYSDRPQAVMMRLMNWHWVLANLAYGEQWRLERKLLHEQIHINIVHQWRDIELRAARNFLQSLLREDAADDITTGVSNLFGTIVMDVAYGIDSPLESNHFTKIALEALDMLSEAFLPGAFLVDTFPLLRYVPKWFPGAGFQRLASASRERTTEMLDKPFKVVRDRMVAGTAQTCMITKLLDNIPEDNLTPDVERAIKHSAGHFYAAGSDTTVSTICCLFLAMARNPDMLAKAQAEIDAVVGTDQLPDFSHWPDLPYVNAIMLELLRWQPVLPIGVAHKSTEDDVYQGYFIPKGTLVIPNHWAMLHNPEDYPNPEKFNPERFLRFGKDGKYELDPTVQDPRNIAFGFGRRICAGMHFAEQSLYIIIANILAAFNVTAPMDEEGKPVYPDVNMSPGLLSHPMPFRCVIKSRSKHHEEIINLPLPERGI